ncbi:hypothetical protein J6590_097742 [Homalodisca vitripennis]|nr:hypothetical protein J6590_097742 [Homalodisca vitripennis]
MLPAVARDTPESSSVRVLMVALHTVIHTLTRHTTLACLSVYPPRLRLSQVGGRYSTGAVCCCRAALGVGEAGYPLPVSLSLHGHTSVHSFSARAKHFAEDLEMFFVCSCLSIGFAEWQVWTPVGFCRCVPKGRFFSKVRNKARRREHGVG